MASSSEEGVVADGGGGDGDEWCTVESDPAVFTEMLESLGCRDVELEELYSLDDDEVLGGAAGVVHGLIFLFQWNRDAQVAHAASRRRLGEDEAPPDLFFARQVTTNACATQAVLSVVMNAAAAAPDDDDHHDHDAAASSATNNDEPSSPSSSSSSLLGKTLSDFKSFTRSFPPQLKGVAISSSEEIRRAHNAFSRRDSFLSEGRFHVPADEENEAFHFVAYVPHRGSGTVYELDGLQLGPIAVGDIRDGNVDEWWKTAREAIQERMASAAQSHIKFNLMAVVPDKRLALRRELARDPGNGAAAARLAEEELKRERWRRENQRRRHNYVPLAVQLLKELARSNTLQQHVDGARERVQQKRAAAMQKKASSS
jgi:ubiquitin carboxyl-terminal hydrolase L5